MTLQFSIAVAPFYIFTNRAQGFPFSTPWPILIIFCLFDSVCLVTPWASPVVKEVKNLPVIQEPQETRVRSLGQEDLLEKGMETHSSILAMRIPWTEETGRL